MRSSLNLPFTEAPSLESGNYHLVDCVDIFQQYLRINDETRRPAVFMPAEYTNESALDVEMTMVMNCLESFDQAESNISSYVNDIHEVAYNDPIIIDNEDGSSVTLPAVDETITDNYTAILKQLTFALRDRLKLAGCYDEFGDLIAPYKGIYGEGMIVLG